MRIGDFVRHEVDHSRGSHRYGTVEAIGADWVELDTITGKIKMKNTTVVNKTLDKYTLDRKRALIDSFAGRFITLRWIKKDGTHTMRLIQHLQHKMFADGHASKAKQSTVADKPQYYTCVDVDGKKWVNVDLSTLYFIKCGGFEAQL